MLHRTARSSILFALTLLSLGSSHGQSAAPNISPELAHRIESMLRSKMEFPPASSISFGPRSASEVPGYDRIQAHFSSSLSTDKGDIPLLVSNDGTRVAQFMTYDIAVDPKLKLSTEDRPARGGPLDAPVVIVSYDDLECPYCARLHAALFPALMDRYKNQVRIAYRSFPLEGHLWAMHAAVDVDCLGAENAQGYWAAVDQIHAHAGEYGGAEHLLAKAEEELDTVVINEGHLFHVDESALRACIKKQDTTLENANIDSGKKLGVYRTPTFFINGMKIDGAVPISFVFEMVDNALNAAGATPPPPMQEQR
ncbi:DsbA family protein [Terriglobus saanensis]|uniref:Putative lipoprotein n=1 Tax=Terriglobus saanensis (strain ATCC BAA-1853 / DSM 23119 / SP1PR4) TaxID=401053 RepID=E8V1E5_TERSS|nr:thioredoxin domain-containing protein [Terriglobus saanensis]ADV81140.1 putative lipoprotein [Terriglobus saanensis SP1PR4]